MDIENNRECNQELMPKMNQKKIKSNSFKRGNVGTIYSTKYNFTFEVHQ